MTNEDRERDTLPPSESRDEPPHEPPTLTEQRFREILQEVVGTPLISINERMNTVEERVSRLERAATFVLAANQLAPIALSLVSLACALVALAR